ncbi:hypothetical protein JCM17823_19730 [Halorubrum gandharaense]
MTDSDSGATRRNVLKAAGVTVAAGIGGGALMNTGVAADTEWDEVETPTDAGLNDVVQTADGPYAVGEGGVVMTRNGGEWEIVVENGPNVAENPLNSVDVTDDGERIYFNGGSGALGAYDVLDGVKYDYTAPEEKTSTWEGIAVSGEKGDEWVINSNGSGETFEGDYDAEREADNDADCMEWGEVTEPAGGATIPEVEFADDDPELAFGVDTSQEVFSSDDYNETWEEEGIYDAAEAFNDLVAHSDVVFVAAGGGVIYRYDCDCNNWTPVDVGERDLLAIDRRGEADGGSVMAAAGEGVIYERTDDGWEEQETPVGGDLQGVTYGDDTFFDVNEELVDVAVGGDGTVVERE